MKQLIKHPLQLMMILVFCFASCSKKDNAPEQKASTKTLLTSTSWSAVKYGTDVNKNGKIDGAESLALPAGQYIYFTFLANGTGTQNLNGAISDLTWSLVDEQTMLIKLGGDSYVHIKVLTTNQFVFEQYDSSNKTLETGVQCESKIISH